MVFVKKENVIYKIHDSEVQVYKHMGFCIVGEVKEEKDENRYKEKLAVDNKIPKKS